MFVYMDPMQTRLKRHRNLNIKPFLELLDIKQEAVADQLGGDWLQKKVACRNEKKPSNAHRCMG
jgi:hypothetical protein